MIRLIFLSDFTETYASNLLKGILSYAHDREPWVICRMPPSYKQEHGLGAVVDWALKWGADAVIGQFAPGDDVSLFLQKGIVVLAQDYKVRFESIPNITGDYLRQGALAADYFVNKGFRHFAFYGYENAMWSSERWEGFVGQLRQRGYGDCVFDFQKQPLDDLWYYESEPLARWILSLPHPTALLACDDTRANKIIEVCQTIGLRVPMDIAVLGVDNDEITCSLSFPPLSSISLDVKRGGYEAAALIDRLVTKGSEGESENIVVESVNVVERQSTDIYATENLHIQKVLDYIHQHLSSPLSTPELLRHVPLSRRLLETTFRKETGQTIHQYVTDLRIQRFCQLLISSERSISDLTVEVGLPEPKNLSRQFRQRLGMTPISYRRKFRNKK